MMLPDNADARRGLLDVAVTVLADELAEKSFAVAAAARARRAAGQRVPGRVRQARPAARSGQAIPAPAGASSTATRSDAAGTVTVRDLDSGQQVAVPVDGVTGYLAGQARRAGGAPMTSGQFSDHDTWFAQLPGVVVAAGALITDPAGRVLIVKPNYRDHWTLPGGVCEHGEPPHAGCVREVAEEVGLVMPVGGLLAVDWSQPYGADARPIMHFVFDGGTVPDGIRIVVPGGGARRLPVRRPRRAGTPTRRGTWRTG